MRLILVRHGQTTSNVGGLLDTDAPGADLTDLGREQAAALPGALAGEPIGALYASTLVRTQQTAAPLAEALRLRVAVRPGLREITAGDLEMLGDEQSVATYLEAAFAWSDGDLDRRVPGGEDGHEVFGRFDEVIEEIVTGGRSGPGAVLLVSHGAVLRSWCAARVANLSTAFVARKALANTGVVVLDGDPGGWTAVSWEGTAVEIPVPAAEHGPAGQPVDRQGR